MKYSDLKNNIVFNNVKLPGAYHASGPIGHNGMYNVLGDNITITDGISLINAIDIDWNGALVDGITLNTTGDVLNWIRNRSTGGGGGGGTSDPTSFSATIDSDGYLWINGTKVGKVKGENGTTPSITYTESSAVSNTSTGRYTLGNLKIGNQNIELRGIDTTGGGESSSGGGLTESEVKALINNNVTITPTLNNGIEIATVKIGTNALKSIYAPTSSGPGNILNQPLSEINSAGLGNPSNNLLLCYNNGWGYKSIDSIGGEPVAYIKNASVTGNTLTLTKKDNSTVTFTPSGSDTGVSLNSPLSNINSAGLGNPSTNKSFLLYNNGWGYTTLDNIAESINQYFTEHNYYTSVGSQVSISNLNNTGSRIATITINNTPYDIKAPTSGGSVISGDTVSVTSEYQSGGGNKKLATISVNNNPTEIYMPAISKNDISDFPNIPSAYDDTAIQGVVSSLSSTLSTLRDEFDRLHKWTLAEIEGLIDGALNDWDWISQLDPDTIFNLSGWNDKLKAYIQQVIKTDADGLGATWSSLVQQFDSLSGKVQTLEEQIAAGGQEIDYEHLASLIEVSIDNIDGLREAITKLESVYSWFETAEGDVNTLKTNVAGLTTRVSAVESSLSGYATSISTLGDKVGTLESLSSLLLNSKTDLENRMASAEASLATKATLNDVSSGISEAISGLYTKSEVDGLIASATTNIVTLATMLDYVTGQIGTATSGLATTAYVDGAVSSATTGLISQSTMENYVSGQILTATAGFVASTDVYTKTQTDGLIASAKSEMSSEIDGVRALISAGVTKTDNGDGTYSIDSDIIISADLIELDGDTIFSLLSAAKTDDPLGRWYDKSLLTPGYIKLYETSGNTNLISEYVELTTDKITVSQGTSTESTLNPALILIKNGNLTGTFDVGYSGGGSDSGCLNIIVKDNSNNYSGMNIDPESGTTFVGDVWISSIAGDLSVNGDLSVSGDGTFDNITTSGDANINGNLKLTPDGTNGTFLNPYGINSVYNKYYTYAEGGIQEHIKLALQTGSSDNSTVECAVHNVKLLGEAVQLGNVSLNSLIEFRGDSTPIEFKSPAGFQFNNSINLYDNSLSIANLQAAGNDFEIETPNGQCIISDLYNSSDERIKENIIPVEVSVSDIASARIVNYNLIGKNKTKFGSIALDWQNIFPEAVKESSKGVLGMDYGAIALGAAVVDAREIVALKEENRLLKERLAAIEQKLEAINNALG